MIELLERGYDIHGLDASADMLARCRERARERGIEVTLYEQEMQHMSLPRSYGAMFLAGQSFTLLTSDQDARQTLRRMVEHLEPGGAALIPLGIPDELELRSNLGRFKEARDDAGALVRVGAVDAEVDRESRATRLRLRYERVLENGSTESTERDIHGRFWSQEMFREMMLEAGFSNVTAIEPGKGRAAPDASSWVVLARRA